MNRINISLTVLISLFFLYACKSEKKETDSKKNTDSENIVPKEQNILNLTIEKPNKDKYFWGDKINITAEITDGFNKDTVILSVNDKDIAFLTKNNASFVWNTQNAHTGRNIIEIELTRDKQRYRKQKVIILFSDIKPEEFTYRIKNIYKHDVNAYTQGLFYHNGYLYEATGLKGESTVRKVKLETGDIVQSFAIPKDVFGEGITLYDNKIIQLSWEAGRGFVYDLNTFKHLDEFLYSGEGWGLCSDGRHLFMTNGSPEVKVLEPQTFSVVNTFEVYDNKGPVKYLNELEYINGSIYANIYQYEKIVKFDPKTGKVIAYIDLSHILPMNDYKTDTDVLNGIAYDKENDRIFVTGKKWPKLFEIELIKK